MKDVKKTSTRPFEMSPTDFWKVPECFYIKKKKKTHACIQNSQQTIFKFNDLWMFYFLNLQYVF